MFPAGPQKQVHHALREKPEKQLISRSWKTGKQVHHALRENLENSLSAAVEKPENVFTTRCGKNRKNVFINRFGKRWRKSDSEIIAGKNGGNPSVLADKI